MIRSRPRATFVVPSTVATEADYLLRARVGAHAGRALLADLASGRYQWEAVDLALLLRAKEIDERHADLDLGLADASVVAVAERLAADAIVTLDREHLAVADEGRRPLLP